MRALSTKEKEELAKIYESVENVNKAIKQQAHLLNELNTNFISFAAEQSLMVKYIFEKVNAIEDMLNEQFQDVEAKATHLFPCQNPRDKIRHALYIFMVEKILALRLVA